MTTGKPWTDEEYGFVQESDWPASRIAEELGRSVASIWNLKHRFRRGWTPKQAPNREWLAEEDQFILDNPTITAQSISEKLDRTASAINQRRLLLRRTRSNVPTFRGNYSPFSPGARPLLARTCPSCGYLLQANWFQEVKGHWCKTCKRCRQEDRESRGIFRSQSKGGRSKEVKAERWKHIQQITIDRAENRGKEWTEKDISILADPDLTIFQKALMLKRTYAGVQVAAQKRGFAHKVGLGDPERDQWLIDNPNADRVDEIRAQFEVITADVEIVEPELEPAGAPKRPEFDWDD